MKPIFTTFYLISIIILSFNTPLFAQDHQDVPNRDVTNSTKLSKTNVPESVLTDTDSRNNSIEVLIGYGYFFHLNLQPEYKPQGEAADDVKLGKLYQNIFNINLDIGYNHLFNQYYSIGVTLQVIANLRIPLLLVNRLMLPISDSSLYLYLDLPIGIDLSSIPWIKYTGVHLIMATRFGLSWQINDSVRFNTRVGLEMGLASPYTNKDYWHVNQAGVRLSLGVDFPF